MSWEFAYKTPDQKETHVSEACAPCTLKFVNRDPEMQTRKYWDSHQTLFKQLCEYGLLSGAWLNELGMIMTEKGIVCKYCKDDPQYADCCLGKH